MELVTPNVAQNFLLSGYPMLKASEKAFSIKFFKMALYVIQPLLLQQIRRISYGFAQLLTTAFGSCATLTLFLYIFGDFIREKLPQTNSTAAESLRLYLIIVLIMASATVIHRWCNYLIFNSTGWVAFLNTLGIDKPILTMSARVTFICLVLLLHFAAILVIELFFGPFSTIHWTTFLASFLLSAALARKLNVEESEPHTMKRKPREDDLTLSIISWRKSRLTGLSWQGAALPYVASGLISIGILAQLAGRSIEVTLVCALFGGIILSWVVPFVIADDLRFTWLERQCAISHKQWIAAWQKIFSNWSFVCFVSSLLLTLTAVTINTLTSHTIDSEVWLLIWRSIQVSFLCAFPVWLAPSLVLQIDGRKVTTNIIMLTLINIFVGTGIIALPILIPGIWLLGHEAHRYQEGRFARASYY